MYFDPNQSRIDLVTPRKKFFMVSGIFMLAGVILLSTLGLNLGIDFSAGTTIDVLAEEPVTEEEIAEEFAEIGHEPDDITIAGDDDEIGRAQFIGDQDQQETLEIQNHFEDVYGNTPTVSTVSPVVGEELAQNAVISVLIASLGIVLYLAVRFEFIYGISAVIALFHDALFILVVFSIVQFEVNIPFVAAVLTVVGYSINDTIVTFDRIRENLDREEKEGQVEVEDVPRIVNNSLIQTLARSINIVLTVLLAAGTLFVLGGEALRSFSFAIVVGLVAGTLSSLFIAAQLFLEFKIRQLKKRREKEEEEAEGESPPTL